MTSSRNTARRRRLVIDLDEHEPNPGEVLCLVQVTDLLPDDFATRTRWHYLTDDSRTNVDEVQCWSGFLGAFDDVSERALGAWRVVSVRSHPDHGDVARALVSLVEVTR